MLHTKCQWANKQLVFYDYFRVLFLKVFDLLSSVYSVYCQRTRKTVVLVNSTSLPSRSFSADKDASGDPNRLLTESFPPSVPFDGLVGLGEGGGKYTTPRGRGELAIGLVLRLGSSVSVVFVSEEFIKLSTVIVEFASGDRVGSMEGAELLGSVFVDFVGIPVGGPDGALLGEVSSTDGV